MPWGRNWLRGLRVREEGRLPEGLQRGERGMGGRREGFAVPVKVLASPSRIGRESGARDPDLSPQSMESQVEEWYREVGELQAQTAALPLEPASKELVGERQNAVGERLVRLLEPLQERRRLLLASKELHQVAHDLDDELVRPGVGSRGGRGGGTRVTGRGVRPEAGQRVYGVEVGGEALGPWRV